jgi:ATP-dependent RNA helicase RhlE
MNFNEMNLAGPLVSALEKLKYVTPTPIQQKAIPAVLAGRDLFGCAQTGTGKTAAFALPILHKLSLIPAGGKRLVRALILAPTRELALQISASITAYGTNLSIRHTTLYGGVSQFHQVKDLTRGVDLLVATPGRLKDLVEQGYVKLNAIEHLVLDEADRMLDMGFIHDIRKIITWLPKQKQSLFFSATVSPEIQKLASGLLHDPLHVSVTPVSSATPLVEQSVYYVTKENKRMLLRHVITDTKIEHVLVFTRTKHGADKVARDLNNNGIRAEAIHGNKSQGARQKALKGFKDRQIRVLVATDIASRGIDVDRLSHVINYELPEVPETYVHRIGRTGRAGATGIALSFCAHDERGYLKDISKLIKSSLRVVEAHPFK